MPKRSTDYRKKLLEDLNDPIEAANYLNAAREDSREMLLMAMRDVAETRQMAKIAEMAGVSRESLYSMLNAEGNPTIRNFLGILEAVGIDFEFRARGSPKGPYREARRHSAAKASMTAAKRKRRHRTFNASRLTDENARALLSRGGIGSPYLAAYADALWSPISSYSKADELAAIVVGSKSENVRLYGNAA
jgi:probable addiction module antidote protein